MSTEMDHFRILLTTDTAVSVTNGVISVKKFNDMGHFKKCPHTGRS